MDGYHHMGNMEQHLGIATSTTSLHYQLTDLWRSPRGTVLRIQALALVAIALSFLLVVFGSCRRWSNRWIVQKGFLAAQVLSLSLGTYSIGLMQSSSVKSDMYPIWAVSLFTLFGCVDPVTSYNGLDYNGPLSKVIFQLCLYCGYVLLMSVSTRSSVVGNVAIDVLCATTFIKGFHRSMALILPSERRDQMEAFSYTEVGALVVGDGKGLQVIRPNGSPSCLQDWWLLLGFTANEKTDIENVCIGYYLSYLLQRHILGLDNASEMEKKREEFKSLVQDGRVIDFKRSLKAIEVALALLYEAVFTSNEFLHYYEARTSSFWALASLVGICFLGLDVARHSQHRITSAGTGAGSTVIIGTTTADLIITLVILVSLALVQLVQLMQCWVSNWARVTFACEYAATRPSRSIRVWRSSREGPDLVRSFDRESVHLPVGPTSWRPWMRLRVFMITRFNWFDKYLWQDRIGQYSLIADKISEEGCINTCLEIIECCGEIVPDCCGEVVPHMINRMWVRVNRMLGMQYIRRVLWELLVASSASCTKGEAAVRLHDDVKASVADFLGQIKSTRIGEDWVSLFLDNGLEDRLSELPYALRQAQTPDAYAFTYRVMVWHIATCYCEEAELQGSSAGGDSRSEKNRRVAMDLSKYCAYLVMSAPELLPGPSMQTKRALKEVEIWMRISGVIRLKLQSAMRGEHHTVLPTDAFSKGLLWGQQLRRCSEGPWKVLALLWVQTLLYAAPYGKMEAHLQRLTQGGEFITHLRALLFHIGIDRWEYDLPAIAQAEAKEEEEEETVTNIEESVN